VLIPYRFRHSVSLAHLGVMQKGGYTKTLAAIAAYRRLERTAMTVSREPRREGPTLGEWGAARQAVQDAFVSEGGTLQDGDDMSASYIEWLITGRTSTS
jgi:hypothetical protein